MNTTTQTQPLNIPRATYQSLPAADRARIESKAVDVNFSYAASTPPAALSAPPAQVSIPAPAEVPAPTPPPKTSLLAKLKNKAAAWGSILGATFGSAATSVRSFLQNIVSYVVAACKAVVSGSLSVTQTVLATVGALFSKAPSNTIADEKDAAVTES